MNWCETRQHMHDLEGKLTRRVCLHPALLVVERYEECIIATLVLGSRVELSYQSYRYFANQHINIRYVHNSVKTLENTRDDVVQAT